ncbi:sodium:solute symporter [Arthrobacter sp. M4]|uniref:sodium:solute symporter family protein n=1 Tax=Arthrobacter sp. M4 TaxID=218160 RepID=UPI001CDCA7DB|nr:sodium:solute symporter family protein [Arthrobacter sp. M4]MCA4132518.1 sodium:solute symporter family protein [Arthrobacter sp. M4]
MVVAIIGVILVVGSVAGGAFLASRGTKVDVQEWSVGGRRFGTWLFWFLLAGETFTASALLGSSQAIFSGGAPGFFVLGTVALAAPVGYFLVPRIQRAGKVNGLTTMGDFFSARFNARWFGGLITVFGIIALLLYTRVQLTGLSLILETLFGTAIPSMAYVFAGGFLVVVFVFIGGMRSAAFVAVVKDILLVLMLLIVAVGAAHAAGVDSVAGIFDEVRNMHPDAGTLPGIGGHASMNEWWWMSFLLLTPLGAFALPHAFQVAYTARNSAAVRKNQIIQPLYSLFYVLIAVIALAAILALPNLPAKQANGSLLIFVASNYPEWVVGLLAGCGVIVALVPTAVIMITASSMFTSNVLGEIKPSLKRSLGATRVSVIVFTLLGVLITAFNSEALLSIMTGVYSAVGQLAPALFLSFLWRRTTAVGLTVGAVAGGAIVLVPALGSAVLTAFPAGTVVGLPALVINLLLAIVVSLLTKRPPVGAIAVGMPEISTAGVDADAEAAASLQSAKSL